MSDWVAALEALGVVPLPGERALTTTGLGGRARFAGVLDGKRLELTLESNVALRVPIDPPLDLGLEVRPCGVFPQAGTQPLGDRAFDALFEVVAYEHRQAAFVLTPAVLRLLVTLLQRSLQVSLRDDVIHVVGESEAWLRTCAPLAVEVAHRIDDRRADVPLPAALQEHRAALARFASDHLLRIDDAPIRLAGTVEPVRLAATVRRASATAFTLSAAATLDDSLNLDLRVEPARLLTPLRALLPGQTDHRIGDAALDAALWIRTSAPELLARALDTEARQALSTLVRRTASFILDDRGLTLEHALQGPSELLEVLRAALALPSRLARAVRAAPPSPAAGPFR